MRSVSSSAFTDALAARTLIERDFAWLTAKTRDTGLPVSIGLWSGAGDTTFQVVDGLTGVTVERSFYGAGTLVQADEVPLTADISVREIEVRVSQIAAVVELAVRTYDVRNAPIQLYRGLLNPATRLAVAPAEPRFVGFVDRATVDTPAEGKEGGITLTCVSHTRELTRTNPDVRSHVSQKRRSSSDKFYQDAVTVGEWEIFWGKSKGSVVP